MRRPASRPGHPAGLRRVVTGTAAAALVAATLVPTAAASADENTEYLGSAEDFGVSAPDGAAKYQDGALSGADVSPNAYFVQLKAHPALEGGSVRTVAAQRESFLERAERLGAEIEVRQAYDGVWSGLSVTASKSDVLLAAGADQVEAVFPVVQVERPTEPQDMTPDMRTALGMTGADIAQSELGFTGDGMKIGIIDTGVDIDHPDLGGSGVDGGTDFPTEKVAYGIDLVGDAYNSSPSSPDYSPTPVPDPDPDDCNGHGTHVAGIAAADGDPETGVRGVAYEATIGAYRVFGCEGSTESDIILSAMETAFDDGMDVINMSIGSAFMSWPQYPTAAAGDAMVEGGMVVVASIGNSGADGLYSAGAPGVGDKVIGVASYDNVEITTDSFAYGEADTPVAYFPATGAPTPPTEGTEPLSRLGPPGSVEARACTADGGITDDIAGTVVLIERGVCTFHEKALNAQNAGAAGVILYNNQPGYSNATVEGEPPITIPLVAITAQEGAEIDAVLGADPTTTMTWTEEEISVPNPTGGLISSFSSFGTTADLKPKPDLGAPGGSVLSTYPLENGAYATISGTSMAAPHVAGAVALLLEAHPDLPTERVRDVLQNSADPKGLSFLPTFGLEPVHRQGAGMLDVDDAILAGTRVTPGKLSAGESGDQNEPFSATLSLTNHSDQDATYTITHVPAVATAGSTYAPGYWGGGDVNATVEAPATVAVPAGATIPVEVTITAPPPRPDTPQLVYGGYIEMATAEGEDQPLRVPYTGFAGDYQDIEVLTPTTLGVDPENPQQPPAFELPVLGQLDECDILRGNTCTAGGNWDVFPDTGDGDTPVYTMVDGNVPTLLVHFEHQSRSLTMSAYHANADGSRGELAGVVHDEDYLARSGTANGFSPYIWNGEIAQGDGTGDPVADGRYILEVEVLKALGDPGNPEQVETYTSEPFTIADASGPQSPEVERLHGPTRYSTAARVARQYDPGVEVAFIATGQDFPDALAGAARAGSLGGPVLLVKDSSIPGATQAELRRLRPENIVVLGGADAIEGRVVSSLRRYTDGTVERVFGDNRYQTAALVSAEHDPGVDVAYVATGQDFPDALTGAARAGALDGPVLLVKQNRLPGATAAELDRLDPGRIVVLGGPAAVSGRVERSLGRYGDVQRQPGGNRYETAATISGEYPEDTGVAFIATGQDFPDALAGAARAGHLQVPVLLVKEDTIPTATLEELNRLQPQRIVILGGVGVVSQDVQDILEQLSYTD